FADLTPEASLASHAGMEGLIVLRSFGKFFGLAGLRLGAVLAPKTVRDRLFAAMGPWATSGPALEIGAHAYANDKWIGNMRRRLRAQAAALDNLFVERGIF